LAGLIYSKKGKRRLLPLLALILILISLLVPQVLEKAPLWEGYFDPSRFGARITLIQKAWAIIGDNPFIGIGINGSKASYYSGGILYDRGLPHNFYLKAWAEFGLFGLISQVIWLIATAKLFRNHFSSLSLVDQVWMLLFIPFFFMSFFLDIGTISQVMLVVFVGINYSLYSSNTLRPEGSNQLKSK
jgi:O-antigen ligase